MKNTLLFNVNLDCTSRKTLSSETFFSVRSVSDGCVRMLEDSLWRHLETEVKEMQK